METKSTCATCACFITEEFGEPCKPFCAMRDLYTFVKPTQKACGDYVKAKKDNDGN